MKYKLTLKYQQNKQAVTYTNSKKYAIEWARDMLNRPDVNKVKISKLERNR